MKNKGEGKRRILLHILGLSFCTLPPIICTLSYFPLWESDSGKSLAGGVALLLAISALPLIKHLSRLLTSGASYVMWALIFLTFLSLSRIAEQMTVISFVGFISNLIGAVLIRIARGRKESR